MAGKLRVLEVGAGTGAFTRAIVRHLAPGDVLDVFEINPAFEPYLQASLAPARARGVACQLHLAAVEQMAPEAAYHFIISALPLNNFPPAQVQRFLDLFMDHLRPEGVLSYFEYSYIRGLKRVLVHNPAERARLQAVGAVVEGFLRLHPSHHAAVPFNLPPAVAHHVRR